MPRRATFYRQVLATLATARVPYMIGGSYALGHYLGVDRGTKDLDLMICEEDWPAVARALRAIGVVTRLVYPHWLGKALAPSAQVDIIFNGGNGATPVGRDWFTCTTPACLFDRVVRLVAPEELLWSKAFVMERERFDGADVLHLLRAMADELDWPRLCRRFRGQEAVLRAHLVLFSYVYPGEAHRVPSWVEGLLANAARLDTAPADLCRGTLLSRAQYLDDVELGRYRDARLPPFGPMTDKAWLAWTNAIEPTTSRVRPGRRTAVPRRKALAPPAPSAAPSSVGRRRGRPVAVSGR